jgi:hypothetical protein
MRDLLPTSSTNLRVLGGKFNSNNANSQDLIPAHDIIYDFHPGFVHFAEDV